MTAPWKELSFFWHLCSWSLENCTVSIQRRLSPGATKAFTSTGLQVRIKHLRLRRLLYIWQNFLCLITPFKIYSSTADIANPMVELVAKGITSAIVNTSGYRHLMKLKLRSSHIPRKQWSSPAASTVKDFRLTSDPRRLLPFPAQARKLLQTHRWGWCTVKRRIFS